MTFKVFLLTAVRCLIKSSVLVGFQRIQAKHQQSERTFFLGEAD